MQIIQAPPLSSSDIPMYYILITNFISLFQEILNVSSPLSFLAKVLFCCWACENKMPAGTSLPESFQKLALHRAAQTLCIQMLAKGNQTLLKQVGLC